MASSPISAGKLRDGLQQVAESIQHFSNAYQKWLTLAPTYSSAPSLTVDDVQGRENDLDSKTKRIRPDFQTLCSAYCPISGPRWDEYRNRLIASTSVKGLTMLRNQIESELVSLERVATQNQSWDSPHPYSNATHYICYWQEILFCAFVYGPVTSIQDRFPFQLDLAVQKRKNKIASKSKGHKIDSHSVKVDIVSQRGNRWTRLYIVKPEKLRAEFREAESYMLDDSDSEAEAEQNSASPQGLIPTDLAMDSAASDCSLMQLVRQLRQAADVEAQARVQCSEQVAAAAARHGLCPNIEIELVLTRIQLTPVVSLDTITENPSMTSEEKTAAFYKLDEWDRFNARIWAIEREALKLGIKVICGFRHLPTEWFGAFEYPSFGLACPDATIRLPKIPDPPPQPRWRTTEKINLDVTAMIALVSDTTHGSFHDQPSAMADQATSPTGDPQTGSNGIDCQQHFRTFSIRKEALEAHAAELSRDDTLQDKAAKALDSAAAKEGRALAIQLEREMTFETLFDAILGPILGRNQDGSLCQASQPVELFATVGAIDRLKGVSSTVGGPNEKLRVKALLGEDGLIPDDFWKYSKWASPEHAYIRACIQLPIQPLADLGPLGRDSLQTLKELYPDMARRHFMSHMIETLESCLSELWGEDWTEISEDLPRSKYKKLKQDSVHQAGGQTYTTLRSIHACARYGMTTLTSNMDSIQWLLKEMNRRPYGANTLTLLQESKDQDVDALFDSKQIFRTCFLLLHPRSLSEQMRVTSKPPSWRKVLADIAAEGAASSIDETDEAATLDRQELEKHFPNHGNEAVHSEIFPLATLSHSQQVSSVTEFEQSSDNEKPVPKSLSTATFHEMVEMPVSESSPRQLSSEEKTVSPPSVAEDTFEPTGHVSRIGPKARARNFAYAIRRGLDGPKPPARLRIRHYKWWPLAKVERFWLRVTNPIAWKDPYRFTDTTLGYSDSLPGPAFDLAKVDPRKEPTGTDWFKSHWYQFKYNRAHWIALCLLYIGWILGFAYLSKSLWYDATVVGVDGKAVQPSFFSCTATYWLRNAGCGLNGQGCSPFFSGSSNDSFISFQCPRGCSSVTLFNPRTAGDQSVNYVPLVVGGGDTEQTYRSDSFICAAALHSGLFKDSTGGCGSVRLVGGFNSYAGSKSHGIESIGFESSFPSSFRFGATQGTSDCTDRRWQAYLLNALMTAFVGFVLRPKRIVWFWTLACVGFWHVTMASSPRSYPPPIGQAIGDFLPFLFCCYAIYRLTFRYVWPAFENVPIEREVWTLGFWWLGVLVDIVFAKVPIQRLVAHDIRQQPGGLVALLVLVIVLVILVINQLRVVRKAGYLPKYVTLYVTGGVLVGLGAAVPGETLRIHHYTIALVLLPGCAFATRLSLIYAAFLLGMFTNGVARWSFAGLLQDSAVVQGDAVGNSPLPSFNTTNVTWSNSDGVVSWNDLPQTVSSSWNGFNLLVDDVLRYEGSGTSFNLSTLPQMFAEQLKPGEPMLSDQIILNGPHYMRLAYTNDGTPGDFTEPAIAFLSNGTWKDASPGAT